MNNFEAGVDRIYKLKKTAPLSYILPSKDSKRHRLLFFDGKTNRALRYGANQKSPFVDQQDGEVMREEIIFKDGFLMVPKENPALQEFLYYTPDRDRVFIEVDREADAAKEVERMDIEADAIAAARNLSTDQMETVARVIISSNIDKMKTSEVKRDIRIFAKRNPEKFLSVISDPELNHNAQVQKFFDAKLLSTRNNGKEVFFNLPDNKKRFVVIPFGKDIVEVVAAELKKPEGIEMLKYMESYLDDTE